MLIQSGGGNVYAVLARNTDFELSISPALAIISTSVFFSVRLRYKSLTKPYFDPLLVPKPVMVGGVERSNDTLRGTMLLNTYTRVHQIGPVFAMSVAALVKSNAGGVLIHDDPDEGGFLNIADLRDDFEEDFTKLIEPQLGMIFPQKDFSEAGVFLTGYDMNAIMSVADEKTPKPELTVIQNEQAPTLPGVAGNLVKLDFAKLEAHGLVANNPLVSAYDTPKGD